MEKWINHCWFHLEAWRRDEEFLSFYLFEWDVDVGSNWIVPIAIYYYHNIWRLKIIMKNGRWQFGSFSRALAYMPLKKFETKFGFLILKHDKFQCLEREIIFFNTTTAYLRMEKTRFTVSNDVTVSFFLFPVPCYKWKRKGNSKSRTSTEKKIIENHKYSMFSVGTAQM